MELLKDKRRGCVSDTSFFIEKKEAKQMSKIIMTIAVALSVVSISSVSANEWKKEDFSDLKVIQEVVESVVDNANMVKNNTMD